MRTALFVTAAVMLAGCSPSGDVKEKELKKIAVPAKNEKAPAVFRVSLDTSKGPIVIEVHRDWAPIGADHFYNLAQTGFYDNTTFFRVVRNFVVQFGLSGDPKVNR